MLKLSLIFSPKKQFLHIFTLSTVISIVDEKPWQDFYITQCTQQREKGRTKRKVLDGVFFLAKWSYCELDQKY
jgi:hypothetical protein